MCGLETGGRAAFTKKRFAYSWLGSFLTSQSYFRIYLELFLRFTKSDLYKLYVSVGLS